MIEEKRTQLHFNSKWSPFLDYIFLYRKKGTAPISYRPEIRSTLELSSLFSYNVPGSPPPIQNTQTIATTHFIGDVYGGVFKMFVKKINEQSCESSSCSTSGSQLLVGTTKSQDFVWKMYVKQALLEYRCHR